MGVKKLRAEIHHTDTLKIINNMAYKKSKAAKFKVCASCKSPAKCKAAGKCLKKK